MWYKESACCAVTDPCQEMDAPYIQATSQEMAQVSSGLRVFAVPLPAACYNHCKRLSNHTLSNSLQVYPDAELLVSTDCLSVKAVVERRPEVYRCGMQPGGWNSAWNTGAVLDSVSVL